MITDETINDLDIEVAKMIKKNLNELNSGIPINLNEKDTENLKLLHQVKVYDEMIKYIFSRLSELIKN